jgi:hypothetical protein
MGVGVSTSLPLEPSGTLPDFDIEVMDFDIEAWTPMYVYPFIEVPNFNIEALYFDFDIGPDIKPRYRSS